MGDDEYATYIRVSTDKDEQISSVENQLAICRYWLEQNGFTWNERSVYKDEGISGTVLLDRLAMQRILEKAKKREIKMVVFKSLSRLARDMKDALDIKEILHGHNVRIISVEEGYDSFMVSKNDMRFEMSSLFNEQYSRMLSVNIAGVLAQKVRNGDHIGKIPYGYDRINKKLVIKDEEAKVIKQIFKWKQEGFGYKSIAKMLNNPEVRPHSSSLLIPDKPIPSSTGGKWQVTSIQRIVNNPLYCGDFILNQYRKEKVGGRKKQIRNPKDKWVIFRDHHPAIITRDLWNEVNNSSPHKGKKITPWNEFRGLIKCSECGSNMVIVQSWKRKKDGSKTIWAYLKCSQYRRGGTDLCVNHAPIQYKDFREFIINQLIEKGKLIALNIESDFEAQRKGKLKTLKRKVERLELKKKDLLDLYLEKVIDRNEFLHKRDEIEEEVNKTKEEVYMLEREEDSQAQIKNIKEAFKVLENQNQDLYEVFKTLIKRIIIHPDGTIDIEYSFQNK
ncbi:MAG: recombinase family protein [Bacillaceae bacterium]|nr:recombinase family protein [Bacillaceae bacterium]